MNKRKDSEYYNEGNSSTECANDDKDTLYLPREYLEMFLKSS